MAKLNMYFGGKYEKIADVIEDCASGKPVFLRGHITDPHVIMDLTISALQEIVERGQLHRVNDLYRETGDGK